MDEKLKIAAVIFSGIAAILTAIIAFINVFPTRTSARVVADRLNFDKETQQDKKEADEYNKLLADRNQWKDRAEKAESKEQSLRDALFACEDEWHKWKRMLEQDGVITKPPSTDSTAQMQAIGTHIEL